MHPTLFELGPLSIRSYGLMVALGMLVGIWLAKRVARSEGFDAKHVESLSFWLIVAGIFGARFLYTFVEHADEYWRRPWEFFAFQKGGISFYGGLLLAIAAAVIYCRRKRILFWQMADVIAPSLALGLAFGKIGCLLAGCCFGKVCDLPWAVTFHNPEGLARPLHVPLHPTQIYEALLGVLLFGLLFPARKWRTYYGEAFLFFTIAYAGLRSILEIYRGDPGHLGRLTTAQTLSIPLVLVALICWILIRRGKLSRPVQP